MCLGIVISLFCSCPCNYCVLFYVAIKLVVGSCVIMFLPVIEVRRAAFVAGQAVSLTNCWRARPFRIAFCGRVLISIVLSRMLMKFRMKLVGDVRPCNWSLESSWRRVVSSCTDFSSMAIPLVCQTPNHSSCTALFEGWRWCFFNWTEER